MRKCLHIIFSVFLLVLVIERPLQAATGKISGSVLDSETGEVLIGANVIIEGFWKNNQVVGMPVLRGAATDEEGFYFIINLQPGTYAVKAQMIGYETKRITNVKVGSNRTITVDFPASSLRKSIRFIQAGFSSLSLTTVAVPAAGGLAGAGAGISAWVIGASPTWINRPSATERVVYFFK